jgi:hypothetical protein
MNFPLLKLELRKNRLSAAAIAASFLVTLPVSRLVASATGMEPAKALEAILLGWMLLGSPFAAALIASSAGAQTASRDAREAEALLPAAPARRAFASLGAAFFLLAAVTAILVGTAWLLGALTPLLSSQDPALNWSMPFWQESSMRPLFIFILLDALLGCWILSYVIGHAIGGGLIGVLLTGTTLFVAAIGFGLQLVHGHWGIDMLPAYAVLGAAALLLKLAAAAKTASWRERAAAPRGAGLAFIAFALLFGPLAGWAIKNYTYRDLLGRLRAAEDPLVFSYQPWAEDGGPSALRAVLAAEGWGTAMWDPAAGLYLAAADGVRELIPAEKDSVSGFLLNNHMRSGSAARDERGVLWATRSDYSILELWREDGDGMKLVRREPFKGMTRFRRRAGRLLLPMWFDGEKETQYLAVDDYAKLGMKAPRVKALTAGAARIGCEPTADCLRRGARTWRLPGRALWKGEVLPTDVGGRPAYFVPVSANGRAWTALCREDGHVEKAWEMNSPDDGAYGQGFQALPDGTLYAREPGSKIGVLDTQGHASSFDYARLRPKFAGGSRSAPALVRRDDGRTWLLWNRTLIEASDAGIILAQAEVPEHRDFRVLHDGLLLDTGRFLVFRAWDGTSRRLIKPR